MSEQASASIGINATPSEIIAVIADFESYPQWARSLTAVDIVSHNADGRPEDVHFILDAGILKADYTLRYTWREGDQHVSVKWTLQSGSLKRNDGSYDIRGTDNASEVVYSLAVDIALPMLGTFRRKAEKVIMDTALTELKRRVEQA